MSYLNISIPPIECFVRSNFLQARPDQFESTDIYLPCVVFGLSSISGNPPLFHFLMEDGGIWWRMPIHAFCKFPCPQDNLHQLVLWNSFSSYVSVTTFDFLKNKTIHYVDRSQRPREGRYIFTLDWSHEDASTPNVGFSENPGQHKCGHVIELTNGNYAIQPNNRIKLFEPSFCTKWKKDIIDRKINAKVWNVEDKPRWMLSDNEDYNYEIEEKE